MDEQLIWSKATAYCAQSEHCEQEVRQKMRAWTDGMSGEDDAMDQVIRRLYQENYLNEERYCRAYAHDKLRYAKWGRRKIALMLQAKGLSGASIAVGLAALPEDEYEEIKQQVENAKRRQLGAAAETYEGRMKVLRHLASHGF